MVPRRMHMVAPLLLPVFLCAVGCGCATLFVPTVAPDTKHVSQMLTYKAQPTTVSGRPHARLPMQCTLQLAACTAAAWRLDCAEYTYGAFPSCTMNYPHRLWEVQPKPQTLDCGLAVLFIGGWLGMIMGM